jgi:hypothetical protein
LAAATGESPLQPASERVRASAKWLIAAFGAIGAAIAIGAQFSNIGKLQGDARTFALTGVGLAFFGIGLALLGVALLLVPRSRTLQDLARSELRMPSRDRLRFRDPAVKYLRAAPELLCPFDSVQALKTEREKYLGIYRSVYSTWSNDRSAANAAKLDVAGDVARPVEDVTARVINWANYATLRGDYTKTMLFAVAPGLVIATVGIVVFALNITDVPPPAPTPAAVQLRGVELAGLDLASDRLAGADLTGADLRRADLIDADLSSAVLTGAMLDGANLTRANLAGAVGLSASQLGNVTWNKTTCPDGKISDSVGGSCVAHLTVPPAQSGG